MLEKLIRFYAVAASLFLLLSSCVGVQKEEVPELYWPFPPERPRIKFVDIVVGSIDVVGVRSTFERLVFGEEEEAAFVGPLFVALRNGVMYVSDIGKVHVYDFPNKKYRAYVGFFLNSTGLAVAPDGTLFVGDSARHHVFVLRPDSVEWKKLDEPGTFEAPGGMAVDEINKRLIIADAKKHQVRVYGLDGSYIFSIGKRGREPGEFNFPYACAVDREGRIFVSDSGNFRVQVFDKGGNFISAFGGVGTIVGTFARPKGLAVDSDGHVYVVDAAFGNFQIFDMYGNAYLAVGSNGGDAGKFSLPIGIAIDENDKIYVVDQMNRRIQIFQYLKYPDERL